MAMARKSNMAFFLAMAAAALVLNSAAAATTYQVGDGLTWVVPPGGASAYSTWASNKNFTVGDILVFTFTTGNHDVAQVTKASFDSCSGSSPISSVTNGPANITLTSSGEHYYICTFGSHCSAGQKLAINVTGSSSPSTPTPAGSVTPPPPPPPPSAATSIGAAGLSATFLSIALALLF